MKTFVQLREQTVFKKKINRVQVEVKKQGNKIVAIVAANTAMSNDVPKADKSWSFSSKPAYHFSDAPDQTETNLPALKLKITMMMIGRYKMPKPSAPSDRTSPFIRPISLPPPALDWVFQPPHHARLDSGHR